MKKLCKCGKWFVAMKPHHITCFSCYLEQLKKQKAARAKYFIRESQNKIKGDSQ